MIRHATNRRPRRRQRSGTIVPIVAVSLIVLMLVAAWVIDRAWSSAACGELVLSTESAARAAALELLDDSRLTPDGDELRLRRARYAAGSMIHANRVAGSPAAIDIESDVLFASLDSGEFQFDVVDPRMLSVTAGRTAERGNPIGLLLSGLGGVSTTDLMHTAAVRLENRIAAIHADDSKPAPVLPLSILSHGTEDVFGWQEAIVARLGDDLYSVDPETHVVRSAPDGLTEIRVVIDTTADANGRYFSTQGFDADTLAHVIESGWTDGAIDLTQLAPLKTSPDPVPGLVDTIESADLIGRKRIMTLYNHDRVESVVAGRVMAIETDALNRPVLIVQPCVITLAQLELMLPNDNTSEPSVEPNPYLFKIVTVH